MKTDALRIILGDQLTPDLSCLRDGRPGTDVVVMMEVAEETTYTGHHKKKLVFVLAAMRAFAAELGASGWRVDYVTLRDEKNTGTLSHEVARAIERHNPDRVVSTLAGEHRVRAAQHGWASGSDAVLELLDDDRFICTESEFRKWAETRTSLRMEHFYRDMRRKTGLLMEEGAPTGGKWNFDTDNRKPAKNSLFIASPLRFEPSAETRSVINLVKEQFGSHFGDLEPFWLPVCRQDAERCAQQFLRTGLPYFGDYQDAMLHDHKFIHHSVLSPLINVGLLNPLELCRSAETEYREGRAPLNAVEGFIRQIIGWREYVRGIYWLKGPEYLKSNALSAKRRLPAIYWTGETNMRCMAAVIGQTREDAYAHHIQRLMVTGNFALLTGIDPHEVHEWYLAVYADAFEWVEAPNTIGMSQFADGGVLASKPYAASGAYIDRMSDYCSSCHYDVKQRLGAGACPFNALYWDFVGRHRERLAANMRMRPIVKAYDGFPKDTRAALHEKADDFLQHLDDTGSDQ